MTYELQFSKKNSLISVIYYYLSYTPMQKFGFSYKKNIFLTYASSYIFLFVSKIKMLTSVLKLLKNMFERHLLKNKK